MKNLIFLIMLAITMAAQGFTTAPSPGCFINNSNETVYHTRHVSSPNMGINLKLKKAPDDGDFEVKINLTINGDNPVHPELAIAAPSNFTANDTFYYTHLNRNGIGYFYIPKGTYDFLVIGSSTNGTETILLSYDNFEIKEPTTINDSFDSATISVNIVPKGPDGTEIRFNSKDAEGNVISGNQFLDITYKGINKLYSLGAGVIGLYETGLKIRTNHIPLNYELTRIDDYLWTGGHTGMILPIDFSKSEISPSSSNWQSIDISFCKTPINIRKKEVFDTDNPDYNAYNYGSAYLFNNYNFTSTFTTGCLDYTTLLFNENRIDIWQPIDDITGFEMWIYPSGSTFVQTVGQFAPAITGMPIKRGEPEMCQTGIIPSNFLAYNFNEDGFQSNGNPRYSGDIKYDILGNCSPILTTMPRKASFDITYTGRYGENMQIDATGYPEWYFDWSQEERDALGLPVCDVAVNVDGSSICNSIDNWMDVWGGAGVFDAEISTDNILIDESINGVSSAKIHYDSNSGNGSAPTLTALQFRNNDDNVTDRLSSPTDGYLEFYALVPIQKSGKNETAVWDYFETGEIKSAKAEWSPMGQDDWQEVELEEIPELFYLPGFGYCFRGYLNGVNKESENKWYDLRVRIEDEFGAYQEQTISPAFRMESVTVNGISQVETNNKITVFTIDGIKIMDNAGKSDIDTLPAGIYIVRSGNTARKISVR